MVYVIPGNDITSDDVRQLLGFDTCCEACHFMNYEWLPTIKEVVRRAQALMRCGLDPKEYL